MNGTTLQKLIVTTHQGKKMQKYCFEQQVWYFDVLF